MTTLTEEEQLRADHAAGILYPAASEIDLLLSVIDAQRAREGELVAALEDARMLCKNDHAYDNKNSQVFEAVQVMNRALQGN